MMELFNVEIKAPNNLRQHKRMRHGKPQLDTQLQSSSPATPEISRKPTSYSDALAVSPIGDSTRVIPCQEKTVNMFECDYCEESFSCKNELEKHDAWHEA